MSVTEMVSNTVRKLKRAMETVIFAFTDIKTVCTETFCVVFSIRDCTLPLSWTAYHAFSYICITILLSLHNLNVFVATSLIKDSSIISDLSIR